MSLDKKQLALRAEIHELRLAKRFDALDKQLKKYVATAKVRCP